LPGQKSDQVDHERWARIVWHSENVVQTLSRPVLMKHFFPGHQDDAATMGLTLSHEVCTLEVGGETNNM